MGLLGSARLSQQVEPGGTRQGWVRVMVEFGTSSCFQGIYHARMARRAQHLRCSLCERSERAENRLDKGDGSGLGVWVVVLE